MKFKRHIELEHGLRQIDIAPLIDMIFQLLIFFMLTSSFIIQQPGIKINLPKAITSENIKYENIELIISNENIIYLNGKVVTTKELKSLFTEVAKRKQAILIKADRGASLGRVVEVWDMCRDLGVREVNIATIQQ